MKTTVTLKLLLTTTILLMQACAYKQSSFESAVADLKEEQFEKALPALEAESKAGNRDAQTLLAKLYAAGMGVQKDIARADGLLMCQPTEPCTPGKDEYLLAMDFLDGAGVKQSREDAKHWLKVASERGYSRADDKLKEIILEER